MPRRSQRKTNWRPQEERRLLARGVRRGTPDTKKLSRAFIGLALARAEAEARAQVEDSRATERERERDTSAELGETIADQEISDGTA